MRIVVLTISDKHNDRDIDKIVDKKGGYCVAGFEIDSQGKWVRLIGNHEYYKITDEEARYSDGTLCQHLDIIDVDASLVDQRMLNSGIIDEYPDNLLEVQRENHLASGKFRFENKMTVEELLSNYPVEQPDKIFGTELECLTIDEAKKYRKSLLLVRIENLKLHPQRKWGSSDEFKSHYKASFEYNGITYSNITVTDPDYVAELTDFKGMSYGKTYVVLRLGEEFKEKHYILIAKIFDVVYTIENNSLRYFHAFRDCRYLKKYKNVVRELYENLKNNGFECCQECERRKNHA